MTDHDHVVHEDDLQWHEDSHGSRFCARRKHLALAAGGSTLGCSLYELDPGRSPWPYHYHTANEEAIYVLEGEGTIRLDGHERAMKAGSYVALPVGKRGAHVVTNTSRAPLRYLCFSTMIEPEIAVYPDSEKYGLFAGAAPGCPPGKRTLFKFIRQDAEVDYWDGEA